MTRAALALVFVLGVLASCRVASAPVKGPEARCVDRCEAHASQCNETSCARGCKFVLDRLVEHQGAAVVACVAKAKACDDETFAACAVQGPYPDGGPPPPGPVKDIDLEDENQ